MRKLRTALRSNGDFIEESSEKTLIPKSNFAQNSGTITPRRLRPVFTLPSNTRPPSVNFDNSNNNFTRKINNFDTEINNNNDNNDNHQQQQQHVEPKQPMIRLTRRANDGGLDAFPSIKPLVQQIHSADSSPNKQQETVNDNNDITDDKKKPNISGIINRRMSMQTTNSRNLRTPQKQQQNQTQQQNNDEAVKGNLPTDTEKTKSDPFVGFATTKARRSSSIRNPQTSKATILYQHLFVEESEDGSSTAKRRKRKRRKSKEERTNNNNNKKEINSDNTNKTENDNNLMIQNRRPSKISKDAITLRPADSNVKSSSGRSALITNNNNSNNNTEREKHAPVLPGPIRARKNPRHQLGSPERVARRFVAKNIDEMLQKPISQIE
ncbi:hypothetical protein GPJ56_007876 [Histomonas meleagridis]|uniref:uncharacterized protein n=1 Tax=Histomonas meleagridis TaxID=135588 RepID=UPI0035594CD9|nr:hypothetical protein GPJ56_007876 [Histomonas meleagridis]KAH0802976.1 hypothetical protein GO595_004069 [Histomonas meleagridis]